MDAQSIMKATCARCQHWSEDIAAADAHGMRAMCTVSGTYTTARTSCRDWTMSEKYRALLAARAAQREPARPAQSWWLQDNWPTLGICLVIWATASAVCWAILEIVK